MVDKQMREKTIYSVTFWAFVIGMVALMYFVGIGQYKDDPIPWEIVMEKLVWLVLGFQGVRKIEQKITGV